MTFELDAYRRALDTGIRGSGTDDRGTYVVLEDTILYPEGGGQPDDRGSVGGLAVVGLGRSEEGIRHYLDLDSGAEVPTGPTTVTLDWDRRFDHMQQHTAQHLITALAHRHFGWETTSFHLGDSSCDIELTAKDVPGADQDTLERMAAEAVRGAVSVGVEHVPVAEYRERDDIRTRGLPEHHTGDVRLVSIDGIDLTACGGTHVSSTAEIESVKLLGTEPMRGGTRLHWVAGERVRSRLAGHEGRADALRRVLGVGNDELASAATERMQQLKDAQKQVRSLEEELAAATARALLDAGHDPMDAHFDGKGGGFIRTVANRISDLASNEVALLTASQGDDHCFALVAGPGYTGSVSALGKAVAELLDGRGGGTDRVFQGKAGSLARRPEAVGLVSAGSGP